MIGNNYKDTTEGWSPWANYNTNSVDSSQYDSIGKKKKVSVSVSIVSFKIVIVIYPSNIKPNKQTHCFFNYEKTADAQQINWDI